MFEVGFTEIVLIFGIALLVLGPARLPKLAADLGRWAGRARAMARTLRTQLEQEVQQIDPLASGNTARPAGSGYTPPSAASPQPAPVAAEPPPPTDVVAGPTPPEAAPATAPTPDAEPHTPRQDGP
jgi:sec-independent protein translocase protein TatB